MTTAAAQIHFKKIIPVHCHFYETHTEWETSTQLQSKETSHSWSGNFSQFLFSKCTTGWLNQTTIFLDYQHGELNSVIWKNHHFDLYYFHLNIEARSLHPH